MKTHLLFTVGVLVCAVTATGRAENINHYNVVWDSPSADARGSMPLGNGDIGLNVWVEPNGDLHILIGKTDSYDEFNRLLKVGGLRVRATPALFQAGQTFTQALRLADGAIEIKSGDIKVRVWVDANNPVAQVDLESVAPVSVQVLTENWRTTDRALAGGETFSAAYDRPEKMRVNADTVLPEKAGQIVWCHHNVESQWAANLELTGLGDQIAKGRDPILNRSFGAVVRAAGCEAVSDTELKTTTPVTNLSVQFVCVTRLADSPQAWLNRAESEFDEVARKSTPVRFEAHRNWWQAFWNRGWINITSTVGTPLPVNVHSWRLGVDPHGGNKFRGQLAGAQVIAKSLSADEIATLAAQPLPEVSATITGADAALTAECTLAVWINPSASERGRILDKVTPFQADGFLFDTFPGQSLRWMVGQPCCRWPGASPRSSTSTGHEARKARSTFTQPWRWKPGGTPPIRYRKSPGCAICCPDC